MSSPEVVNVLITETLPQDTEPSGGAQIITKGSFAKSSAKKTTSNEKIDTGEEQQPNQSEEQSEDAVKPLAEADSMSGERSVAASGQVFFAETEDGDPATEEPGRQTALSEQWPESELFPYARETLSFSLYWRGIHVGTAKLEAIKGEESSSITSEVHSNAVISAFYKVEDHASAQIVAGRPENFRLIQNEGRHRRNRETIFNVEQDKVFFINHLSQRRHEHDMNGKVLWDIISAFYFLRRQPLEIGTSIYISMFDSNKFLNAEVKILRRETIEFEGERKVPTIVVEPIVTTEGLFQKNGKIIVWLTDDDRRLPVRMETQLKSAIIGRVSAQLTSFSIIN